jgi:clan AA aspartic protease
MGSTYANITIQNGGDVLDARKNRIGEDEIRQVTITALVDTGAIQLCINEEIQEALGLETIGTRPSQLADGQRINLSVVGPVKVMYEDRYSLTSAIVLPGDSEPLLGAIPLEEMDYSVNPSRGILVPSHPEGWLMTVN